MKVRAQVVTECNVALSRVLSGSQNARLWVLIMWPRTCSSGCLISYVGTSLLLYVTHGPKVLCQALVDCPYIHALQKWATATRQEFHTTLDREFPDSTMCCKWMMLPSSPPTNGKYDAFLTTYNYQRF